MGKLSTVRLCVTAGLLLIVFSQTCRSFEPRRIKFAGCDADVTRPLAVYMSCANKKGVCEVRKGNTHSLRAFFKPTVNSTKIVSHAAWNNGWIPIPLPNQKTDGCQFLHTCPMVANQLNAFTYQLAIENFWPQDEYPVIWTLSDEDTDHEILCFKFKINII